MKLAIYAMTVNGAKQGERLKRGLPFADLFIAEAGKSASPDALPLTFPLSVFVAETFSQYDGHIFICATGIVTRVISPLIKDKRVDPAVVCLDEQACFAIAMLSGHRGGANELTERVAHIVQAMPVMTTASDVSETLAVDLLGAPFGWQLDPQSEAAVTPVSAAVVNGEPVIIAQEAGDKTWWTYEKRMPAHLVCHSSLQGVNRADYRGAILVSDRLVPEVHGWENKVVLWRPRSLVLGLGCDRNTPLPVLLAGLKAFSQQFNLSLDAVQAIASIDLKAGEAGLCALSETMQWPYITYAPGQLDGIEGIETPSEYVKKVTGSNAVAEAAALKLSGTKQLLVAKWVFKQDGYHMTIACCRKAFSESLVQQQRKNWLGQKKHGMGAENGIATEDRAARHGERAPENQSIKLNAYGNEVEDGFRCKPRHVDLDRPMLYHRHHLLLCEGQRCAKAGSRHLAHDLRGVLKTMGLASGSQRIKISRTMCVGACRNRATLVIYERSPDGIHSVNNARWLRNVDDLSESQWRDLFQALAENRPITQVLDAHYFAAIEQGPAETCLDEAAFSGKEPRPGEERKGEEIRGDAVTPLVDVTCFGEEK